MRQDTFLKALEQLLLAGVIGVIGLGVNQLKTISSELSELKTNLAVIVEKVREHDRRIDSLEKR